MSQTLGAISHFCRGYSHIASGLPCQDYAAAEASPSFSLAIVSDGHGSERHFRSQDGARLAVEAAREAIALLAKCGVHCPVDGSASSADDCPQAKDFFLSLCTDIVRRWLDKVHHHAQCNPLTDWEMRHVHKAFLQAIGTPDELSAYGCTLMACADFGTWWMAVQIGDGKILVIDDADGKVSFRQPLPDDRRCLFNLTTSMCDKDARNEFRYFCQSGAFPAAVFLGSDGIDNTFGDGDHLEDFYINVYLATVRGEDKALAALQSDLPEISKRGSQDDMSVAMLYVKDGARATALRALDLQLDRNRRRQRQVREEIEKLQAMLTGEAMLTGPMQRTPSRIEASISRQRQILQKLALNLRRLASRKGYFTKLLRKE